MGQETIYALSTPPGRSAVAVVRLSGPDAGTALGRLLRADLPPPRRARLACLTDPREGALLDEALVLWLPGPGSFTGEDMAELHLHGGAASVAGVLAALGAMEGMRPAEPGEFTRRAFDAGRLDLAEVEGLADLLAAETAAQRVQALSQMGGGLSRRISGWADRLTRALAHIEAAIDFPDEDLPDGLPAGSLEEGRALLRELRAELAAPPVGERLRRGAMVALVGQPNVGKSSIINMLADREAAIVTDVPGTTRDVVEVHLDLGGFPVTLADTAGLREAAAGESLDPVEAEGIRRTLARAEQADIKLLVMDASRPREHAPLIDKHRDERALLVLNKADLTAQGSPVREGAVLLSAKTGVGLPALVAALSARVKEIMECRAGEAAPITRARHRAALEEAAEALARSLETQRLDLAAEDLRLALRALGRITGKVDVEALLDVIFQDFCIGK